MKKELKTLPARAKQIIRDRFPKRRPTQVWVHQFFENGVWKTIGAGGFAVSDATMRWLSSRAVTQIKIAYLEKNLECFSDAFMIEISTSELQ